MPGMQEFVLGMLEMLEVISKEDYQPFLELFSQLDTSKDGLLSKEDLVKVAASTRAAEEAKASGAAKQQYMTMARDHASDLIVPSALCGIAFLWHSNFGYLMLVAAMINGLAIGVLLGSPPTKRAIYVKTIVLCLFAVCCTILSFGSLMHFLLGSSDYLKTDYLIPQVLFTRLSDGGSSVLDETWEQMVTARLDQPLEANTWVVFIIYSVVIYGKMFLMDVKTIVCCYRALKEVEALRQLTYTSSA